MPSVRTEVSEIGTALGLLGCDIDGALAEPPDRLRNVGPDTWERLRSARADGSCAELWSASWANGAAFLRAPGGLRGRVPELVEWRGPSRPVGYDVVPADLRVDHVYLISCKDRSRVLHNVAPANLFERALRSRGESGEAVDWYQAVAPDELQELYAATRDFVGDAHLPEKVADLTGGTGRVLGKVLTGGRWPEEVAPLYAAFTAAVAERSAERWNAVLRTPAAREEQLWRLVRLAPSPYFILGSSATDPLRLRISTPFDWRQDFRFECLDIEADLGAGQPVVRWAATATDRATGARRSVSGFVEVRWSHGRFSGAPEAKVQLLTPHEEVPGYNGL